MIVTRQLRDLAQISCCALRAVLKLHGNRRHLLMVYGILRPFGEFEARQTSCRIETSGWAYQPPHWMPPRCVSLLQDERLRLRALEQVRELRNLRQNLCPVYTGTWKGELSYLNVLPGQRGTFATLGKWFESYEDGQRLPSLLSRSITFGMSKGQVHHR